MEINSLIQQTFGQPQGSGERATSAVPLKPAIEPGRSLVYVDDCNAAETVSWKRGFHRLEPLRSKSSRSRQPGLLAVLPLITDSPLFLSRLHRGQHRRTNLLAGHDHWVAFFIWSTSACMNSSNLDALLAPYCLICLR